MVMSRAGVLLMLTGMAAFGQKYTGPRPPKPDTPYLLHATNLVPTEAADAKEQTKKDDITYVIAGVNSSAKTPMASPIFLFQAEKIVPERLQLYKLEAKNGAREITFSKKKRGTPRAIRMEVSRLGSDNLYRIEVDESLETGEYSITPEGSNQVFCFQVY